MPASSVVPVCRSNRSTAAFRLCLASVEPLLRINYVWLEGDLGVLVFNTPTTPDLGDRDVPGDSVRVPLCDGDTDRSLVAEGVGGRWRQRSREVTSVTTTATADSWTVAREHPLTP